MANEKFQNALKAIKQEVPPIWLMRQAGRYHSHYRKLREKHGFVELCKIPELASEVALGPINEFDFDVSILFSDLLFPLEALGMGLEYSPGPKLSFSLNNETIKKLKNSDDALEGMMFQRDTVKATRELLPNDKSLIGFVGGPWTLFVYAVEGSHKGHLQVSKTSMDLFHEFCKILVPLMINNIKLQLDAGAEVVMVMDTAAGELSPDLFNREVVPYLDQMAKPYSKRVAYYAKHSQFSHLKKSFMDDSDWLGFGVDHRWDICDALKIKNRGLLQGNFDQVLLFNEENDFKKLLTAYLEPLKELSVEERTSWICGLGHGILPKTPEKNVHHFVNMVRETFGK